MPDLKTGLMSGSEIGTARFHKLFSEGTANVLITADEVFSNPQKYYIINLDRKDKYEDGHIPGSVRYKPEGTLGFTMKWLLFQLINLLSFIAEQVTTQDLQQLTCVCLVMMHIHLNMEITVLCTTKWLSRELLCRGFRLGRKM